MFFKTYNTEFDEITIAFTDQNGEPLEIREKTKLISYCLLTNTNYIIL